MPNEAARLGHAGYNALIQDAIERAQGAVGAAGDQASSFVGKEVNAYIPSQVNNLAAGIDQKHIQDANKGLRDRLLQQGVPLEQINQLYDEQGNLR